MTGCMGSRRGGFITAITTPTDVFCGDRLLVSYLPSKIDGAKHSWAILALLVKRLRGRR